MTDIQRLHDMHQSKATLGFFAGALNGIRSQKPDMTVDDVFDILEKMIDNDRKSIYELMEKMESPHEG